MLLSLQGSRCQSGAPGEAPGLLHGPPSPTTRLPLKAEPGCGFPRSASPSILPTLSAGLWEPLTGWPWPPFSDSAPTRRFPSRGHREHSHLWPWFKPGQPLDAPLSPHRRLTHSYHPSRPSSRPTPCSEQTGFLLSGSSYSLWASVIEHPNLLATRAPVSPGFSHGTVSLEGREHFRVSSVS